MHNDMPLPEEWRTIPGHPLYDASSHGRIRSRKRREPRIMSPHLHPIGYRRITIDGKQTGVHQLVAAAFHGPCPAGMEVDHINDVRDDNRPENLQYLTRQENLLLRNLPRLGDVCGEGHPLTGENLYVRPSTGRRECKICAKERHGRRVFVEPCSAPDGCDKYATCDLRTPNPICEMHYQRRRTAKKRRLAQRADTQRSA